MFVLVSVLPVSVILKHRDKSIQKEIETFSSLEKLCTRFYSFYIYIYVMEL